MADTAKKFQTRTFTKKGPDGETLTRQVTSPQAEVAARFDGYFPDGEGPDAAVTTTTKSSSGSSGGRATAGSGGGGGTSS